MRRLATVLGVVVLVAGTGLGTTGVLLLRQAEASLTRVPVPELDEAAAPSDARHFLIVGSDSRDGLSDEQRSRLTLGQFEGQRSDTVIYVSISEDRSTVSLVSLPRDLLVIDGGRQRKLTETYAGGPDRLVSVIQQNFGLPVNHYAEISLGGFISVVETLGSVELCLDAPLVDRKSGAEFEAGCQQMDAEEALSFVRSRRGNFGDYERIARQQQFLRATLREMIDAQVLTDVPRLFRLVENVASNVTTDENLGVGEMRAVAQEMRQVVSAGVPMATVPAFPRRIDGADFMVAYRPGAEAMFDRLRQGVPLLDSGDRPDREETPVALISGGRTAAAGTVGSVLQFVGFGVIAAGSGDASLDAGTTTTIYRLPGHEDEAEWVASFLGAPIVDLPATVTAPEAAKVLVAVGDDASL
ncbi:LCP family protein [Egicoccus sp. AB-alg6-2]|uniref:LCP family protein n=1 Tax=Egicoccus sp. AB-alg6-2 TaxID=3242692 RepID=UPI00359E65A3